MGGSPLMSRATMTGPIDLLITNVKMPRLGGVELAERIGSSGSKTKTILISGFTSGKLAETTERSQFLHKPFSTARNIREDCGDTERNVKGLWKQYPAVHRNGFGCFFR